MSRIQQKVTLPVVVTLILPGVHKTELDLTGRGYYSAIYSENRDLFLSAFQGSQGFPVLAISMPIRDTASGNPAGIMNVSLDLNEFSSIVADDIKILGGSGYIFDKQGNMIAHPDTDYILNLDMTAENAEWKGLDGLVAAANQSKTGSYTFTDDKGEPVTTFFSELQVNPDWVLAVDVPTESIMGPVLRLIKKMGAGVLLVLLVVIVLIYFIVRFTVTKPVESMSGILRDIAGGNGDLTKRISVNTKRRGSDEIVLLGSYFNNFVESLNNMIRDLKSVGNASREFGDVLAVNTTEISSSSVEMAATTRSINDQINRLTGRIKESTSGIRQIQEQVGHVSRNIDSEAAYISESSSAVNEMAASIQNLTRISTEKQTVINDLVQHAATSGETIEETAQAIIEISDSVGTIVDLVSVINNVSAQINLLSMNAAIEAAHAGDAGRGFAVVAEEIRKLAETTNEQSKRINDSVKTITKKIANSGEISKGAKESIEMINTNVQTIADTINELVIGMGEISEGSKQIVDSLNELVNSSQSVRESTRVVNDNSEHILHEIEEINKISISTSEGVQELVAGNNQISSAIQSLAEMGSKNNENVKIISEKLDQFTVA